MILNCIARRYWCHLIAATTSLFIVGPLVVMLFDRAVPVEVLTSRVIARTPIYPESTIRVTWEANTYRICPGTVHREWLASDGSTHKDDPKPTIHRDGSKRGMHTFSRNVDVPLLPPGRTLMSGWREYYCNPLHYLWPITAPIQPLVIDIAEPQS